MLPEEKWRGILCTTLVIVLPCKLSKSQSGTSGMEWVQSEADLMREGLMNQWEELESIRVIAEEDVESEILDGIKETGR